MAWAAARRALIALALLLALWGRALELVLGREATVPLAAAMAASAAATPAASDAAEPGRAVLGVAQPHLE